MLPVHFGLGTADIIDSLIITFPNSPIPPLVYQNLGPNQYYGLPEITPDVAGISIVSPVNIVDCESAAPVSMLVANVGNVNVNAFKVNCLLGLLDTTYVIDSAFVPFLSAGETLQVDFNTHHFDSCGQIYNLVGVTQLLDDVNRINDTVSALIYAGYPHDILCGSMFPAPESISLPFFPGVLIKNLGSNQESNFEVSCIIDENDSVVYSQTMIYPDLLEPLEQDIAVFPQFELGPNIAYLLTFYTDLDTDRDRSNDTTRLDITFGGDCHYLLGDINNNGLVNGVDVLYGVAFFKGFPAPPYSCLCQPFGVVYIAGDVNGSCTFNGVDLTYMVSYFKGGPDLLSCPVCPPAN
jgi:hypothetical protein